MTVARNFFFFSPFLSVKVRSWSSSFCNYTWRWSAGRRFERREVSAPSFGRRYLPTCLDASRSSLLSAPALSPRCLLSISNFLGGAVSLAPSISQSPSDSCSISFSPLKLQPSTIHLLLRPLSIPLYFCWRD